MKINIFIRSVIFNILCYGTSAVACVLCLPGLLLSQNMAFILIINPYLAILHFYEKYILNLDYEVRGLENLPAEGSYIIAAKHQSAYETLKLHILFDRPAIILKQELLKIPLWGKFLAKIDPIAIDRSAGRAAMEQIIEGAMHVKEQKRPIIIFPQGTRVHPLITAQEKPYKPGLSRIYEKSDLPIIPLALNSGVFWLRKAWLKRPGKVIFEFLPPIQPGKDASTIMSEIEEQLETHTNALVNEAITQNNYGDLIKKPEKKPKK